VAPLAPIKLYRGDSLDELVESFAGFADLGGGGSPIAQGQYGGDPVTIADNGSALLPWTNLVSGIDLLDRTNVQNPTVLTPGAYALTADINGDALTAGGYVQVGFADGPSIILASVTSAHPELGVTVNAVWVAPAGDSFELTVLSKDGVASRVFNLNSATLVKLS
jgi:hypothetical protein